MHRLIYNFNSILCYFYNIKDRPNPTTDVINVVTVNRGSDDDEDLGRAQNSKANDNVVPGALNALRIVAQLTQ